jgi:hypothetical protein
MICVSLSYDIPRHELVPEQVESSTTPLSPSHWVVKVARLMSARAMVIEDVTTAADASTPASHVNGGAAASITVAASFPGLGSETLLDEVQAGKPTQSRPPSAAERRARLAEDSGGTDMPSS